jgi:hypothetical protein
LRNAIFDELKHSVVQSAHHAVAGSRRRTCGSTAMRRERGLIVIDARARDRAELDETREVT